MSSTNPTAADQGRTTTLGRGAVQSEVSAANARFLDAIERGDHAAAAACYTRGAQAMPPNSEVVQGREAIAAFWSGAANLGIKTARLETVELETAGDSAIEVGRYVLFGADGGSIDRGKYIVLWHREDGMLKIHRDIWNSSMPASAR